MPRRVSPVLFLLLAIGIIPHLIWSQKVTPQEVEARLKPLSDDIARRSGLDRHDAEQLLRVLEGAFQGESVDLHKAEEYIHLALTDGTFDFRREPMQLKPQPGLSENEGKVAGPPVEPGIVGRWYDMVASLDDLRRAEAELEYDKRNRTRRFVEVVASDIRRHSVLEELSGETLQELDHQQLREYLKETLNLPDYSAVADSFDGDFQTSVFVFDAPTTLLRIYGGVSSPVGRYYFCCLWTAEMVSAQAQTNHKKWSDASGLATPHGNLADHLAAVTIPGGTKALIGVVADNFADELGHPERGGNTQIFIPAVEAFPFDEYRLKQESTAAPSASISNTDLAPATGRGTIGDVTNVREVVVLSDRDRVLRFRSSGEK